MFLVSSSAFAWTRGGDERIARKAGQLAPPDLRILIERFEPEYKQGQARAQSDEGSESHRNFAQSGRLRERIERETAATIAMIKSGQPMSSVVEQLGVLSHFVADANNPCGTGLSFPQPKVAINGNKVAFDAMTIAAGSANNRCSCRAC